MYLFWKCTAYSTALSFPLHSVYLLLFVQIYQFYINMIMNLLMRTIYSTVHFCFIYNLNCNVLFHNVARQHKTGHRRLHLVQYSHFLCIQFIYYNLCNFTKFANNYLFILYITHSNFPFSVISIQHKTCHPPLHFCI